MEESIKPMYERFSITQVITDDNQDREISQAIEDRLREISKLPNIINLAIVNVDTAVIPPYVLYGNTYPPRITTVAHIVYSLIDSNETPKKESKKNSNIN